ncbi:MAG: ankyrin repeat domain-containing protein, partial [Planctomycetes bacterium]|nr:ankyrin repeat domain-containing protein [Planctomycetota bacterium]
MKCAKLVCVVLMLMLAVVGCTKEEPTQTQQSAAQVEKEPTKASEPAKQTKPSSRTRPAPVESAKEPAKQTTATKPAEPPKPPELADPNAALLQAVDGGDLDKVEAVIAAGADVNATSTGGFTSLHLALIRGHEEVAALLIANGADTHAKMTNGTTPLHFAAMGGCKRIAEFLIDDGLDLNAQDQMQG